MLMYSVWHINYLNHARFNGFLALFVLGTFHCQEFWNSTSIRSNHPGQHQLLAGYKILESAPVFLQFWKNGCKYFNIIGPDGERLEFNQVL